MSTRNSEENVRRTWGISLLSILSLQFSIRPDLRGGPPKGQGAGNGGKWDKFGRERDGYAENGDYGERAFI